MRKITLCLFLIGGILLLSSCEQILQAVKQLETTQEASRTTSRSSKNLFNPISVSYPSTNKDNTIKDNYFGKIVEDPYRWLEDDKSLETSNWIKEQNNLTQGYLHKIPFKEVFQQQLRDFWNHEKLTTPIKAGNYLYYFRNHDNESLPRLYRQMAFNDRLEEVLDPNTFSQDGTVTLEEYNFSKDGTKLAFATSKAGSDWRTIQVLDLEKKTILSDKIEWAKYNPPYWYKDGFYYSRYDEPSKNENVLFETNEFHQVYYHRLGTSQEEDQLVFADRRNPLRTFHPEVTKNERFLILYAMESGNGNAVYFKPLDDTDAGFTPIVETFEHIYNYRGTINNQFVFLTNDKASNNRLIKIHSSNPNKKYWEELIPESKDVLQNVHLTDKHIIATYLHDASSKVRIFNLKGELQTDMDLPELGTVLSWSVDEKGNKAYCTFTSFARPSTVIELDLKTLKSRIVKRPNTVTDFSNIEAKQVWYKSYDGTDIPMFIVHKKGITLDGSRPTLLYGYGGFNIPMEPTFNVTGLGIEYIVMENDGVFALPNIRGGGEFGTKWHKAGTKLNKQNVFNDFQAAAEFLISNNYTSSNKLAIHGRSNGGLLVGACLTQRPDLYQVAIPSVGVLDMLRYDKYTVGWSWTPDYGSTENAEEFDNLLSYSPLHNAIPGDYPATFITTADSDDRVIPAHSFKFAATLQENQEAENPVLIRIDKSAGHGNGKSISKKIAEATDMLSFVFYNLREKPKGLKNTTK